MQLDLVNDLQYEHLMFLTHTIDDDYRQTNMITVINIVTINYVLFEP